MMRRLHWWPLLAVLAFNVGCSGSSTTSPSSQLATIPGLFGTGASLAGAFDAVWEVECTSIEANTPPCPTPGFQRAQRVPSPAYEWVEPPVGISWIGVNDRGTLPTAFGDSGQRYQYIYRMQFDLSGFDPSTARLSFDWASDNYFGGYRFNSSSFTGGVSANRQWASFKTLTLESPTATFLPGRNLLELRVIGDGETDGLIVRNIQGSAVRR